jgi:muconolactone delta-isomerase
VEFLVTMTTHVPAGTSEEEVADVRAREGAHTRELAEQGHLIRLWLLAARPDGSHALGLWRSEDAARMRAMLDSLPMAPWLTEEVTPLTPHPSDPAAPGSRPAGAQAGQA